MTLPASWSAVPVVGNFQRIDGSFPKGSVIFESAQPGIVVDGVMFTPPRVQVYLVDGQIPEGTALASTTDPDLNIAGWAYEVTEKFLGGREPYLIFVPHDATEIDLATVSPVTTPPELVSALSAQVVATTQGHATAAGAAAAAAQAAQGQAATTLQAAQAAATAAQASAQAAQDAVDNAGPSLPTGGATGQALRKLSATDGDAGWSPHWVVDPATGAMSTVPADRLDAAQPVNVLSIGGNIITNGLHRRKLSATLSDSGNLAVSAEYSHNGGPFGDSSQVGYALAQFGVNNTQTGTSSFQTGGANTQNGWNDFQYGGANTQSGFYNFHGGWNNSQSGYYNFQQGASSTQSGNYNFQSGNANTQSGRYGLQAGKSLNSGALNYTVMFGLNKTATVTQRAYFALDNGIWLKPFAGDAASPEDGVVGYNSTLGKFRFRELGVWNSHLPENNPVASGNMVINTPLAADYSVARTVNGLEIGGHYFYNAVRYDYSLILRPNGTIQSQSATPASANIQNANYAIQLGTTQNQTGSQAIQVGHSSTQTAYNALQIGGNNVQHDAGLQVGFNCTQSGYYNFQQGDQNTQSGYYGFQSGRQLNDGGFSNTFMVGKTRTATVGERAYFAMNNGIWLKPFAGDAASPENGVIGYNSTLGKFRFYQNAGWKSYLAESDPTYTGVLLRPWDGATLADVHAVVGTPVVKFDARYDRYGGPGGIVTEYTDTACERREAYSIAAGRTSTQVGILNRQTGEGNAQSGWTNTQSAYISTQSGYYSYQQGMSLAQSGVWASFQLGAGNTQSGYYGFQAGYSLNDGGFNFTAMYGQSKTATVADRAYFALNNGIWLKPFAGDAASPENGVIGYNSTLHKLRSYENGAWKSLVSTADAGAVGQTLRKDNAGNTIWSSYWVVDPATGFMTSPEVTVAEGSALFMAQSSTTDSGYPSAVYKGKIRFGDSGSFSVAGQTVISGVPLGPTTTQSGAFNLQSGNRNVQSAYGSTQSGYANTQSGAYASTQTGHHNTQSGLVHSQSGLYNTQSGYCSTQSGAYLNDGGFDYTAMFGLTKTATVDKRAYFAMDNGIWLKPVATAPASPENGVIYYDSATHKFRGYANGAWVDLH